MNSNKILNKNKHISSDFVYSFCYKLSYYSTLALSILLFEYLFFQYIILNYDVISFEELEYLLYNDMISYINDNIEIKEDNTM